MEKTKKFKFNLTKALLVAAILGLAAGFVVGEPMSVIKPLGDLFVRLLFMVVPAIVFFSISSSFANVGDVRKLGKWAGKIIGWFLITTAIGTVIGTSIGLIFKPGTGLTIPDQTFEVTKISAENFIAWIPENAFASLAAGDIIQIVFLAIFIGIAIVLIPNGKSKDFLVNGLNAGQELFLMIIKYIMYYAPVGVFALLATSIADFKGALLKEMGTFLIAYSLAFVLQIAIAYFLIFWLVTKLNPFTLMRKGSPALITAFATCSSAGTLPLTLESTKKMGVSEEIADFGIPLGVTFNMDSMAIEIPMYIMLGFYAIGTSPNIGQLFLFVIFGIILSIGCAGIPGAGIAIAVILVDAFGLPVEIVAWISAVFFYLDITGTPMNIWGDMVSTVVVANSEGMLDREMFNS